MFIIMTGSMGSGKDTVADYLCANYDFVKLTLADKLKKATAEIFGWNYEDLKGLTDDSRKWREQKDEYWSVKLKKEISPRKALQLVGTECFRNNFGQDIWVYALLQEKDRLEKLGHKNFVVTDARFINEITILKDENDGEVWEVQRFKPSYYDVIYNYRKLKNTKHNSNDFLNLLQEYNLAMSKVHISETEWIWNNHPKHIINNIYDLDTLYKNIDEIMK